MLIPNVIFQDENLSLPPTLSKLRKKREKYKQRQWFERQSNITEYNLKDCRYKHKAYGSTFL